MCFFFCLSTELFVVVVVIINFEFVGCGVCDFFSRTFQATNVARVCVCEHPKNKMSKIPKFMRMYMCAWVWVFGYHISFRFSVAIMRSRGSSLDKNQNIVSVEHMCSLLFRVKPKKKSLHHSVNSIRSNSNVCAHSPLVLHWFWYNNIICVYNNLVSLWVQHFQRVFFCSLKA